MTNAITKAQALLDEAEASAKTQQDALNIAWDAWQVEVEKMKPLSEAVSAARTVLRNALDVQLFGFSSSTLPSCDHTAAINDYRAAKGGAS